MKRDREAGWYCRYRRVADFLVGLLMKQAQELGGGVGKTSTVADYAAFLYGNLGNRRVLESENKWEDNYNDLLMPGVEKAADWRQVVTG